MTDSSKPDSNPLALGPRERCDQNTQELWKKIKGGEKPRIVMALAVLTGTELALESTVGYGLSTAYNAGKAYVLDRQKEEINNRKAFLREVMTFLRNHEKEFAEFDKEVLKAFNEVNVAIKPPEIAPPVKNRDEPVDPWVPPQANEVRPNLPLAKHKILPRNRIVKAGDDIAELAVGMPALRFDPDGMGQLDQAVLKMQPLLPLFHGVIEALQKAQDTPEGKSVDLITAAEHMGRMRRYVFGRTRPDKVNDDRLQTLLQRMNQTEALLAEWGKSCGKDNDGMGNPWGNR